MSARIGIIHTFLAAGGEGADALASVICRLVIDGAALGELEEVPAIGIDGNPRTIKVPPIAWFERLGDAIDRGVFDNPTPTTVKKVVDRILASPPPEHVKT